MRHLFIVNPVSGKGRGKKIIPWLQHALGSAHVHHEILCTTKPGDAFEWTKTSHHDVVVAVGGDGTINEVAGGLVHSGRLLGVLPAGSGNDLIKSLSIPKEKEQALAAILTGKTRWIDTGVISWRVFREEFCRQRVFVNGIGIGFDAAVAATANRLKHLSGTLLYLVSVLRTIRTYRPPEYEVGTAGVSLKSGQMLLVAVGNGKCAGGGFFLTPLASVDDGLLDICAIEDRGAIGILKLIPGVLRGKHTHYAGVSYHQGREFMVSSGSAFAVHADGEVLGTEISKAIVTVHKRSLAVICPHGNVGRT
jgi:YegS/Rv2252/BmrU family lipid kinase